MGKNLGQHFLEDESVVADIMSAGNVSGTDTVLEIGPGKGVLTEHLLQKADQVIAVEKDPELVQGLEEKFADAIAENRLRIKKSDIRDCNIASLVGKSSYKVIANIPYYLTSELIQLLVTADKKPTRITLLVQKEVAERITAKDGKHSRLSLFVHAYTKPEIIRLVKPESFSPPPKVDSAVIAFQDISNNFFADINPDKFFDVIRVGFQHKRKTIRNNLKRSFKTDTLTIAFEKCDINEKTRPERITLKQWRCLYKKLELE